MYFKINDIIRQNLLLLPYMVSIFDSYVIALYLSMLIKGRAKVRQRRQRCDRRNEEVALTRAYQRNGLDIGQAAKPVGKTLNRLTKGADVRGKGVFGNQDIPIPL